MNDKSSTTDLGCLFLKSLDGSITEQQFEMLNEHLLKNPGAREYYLHYIATFTLLQQVDVSYCASQPNEKAEPVYDEELWDLLAKAEKESPVIQIQQARPEQPQKPVQNVHDRIPHRKINKTSLFSFIVSAAAVVFFVILANLDPAQPGVEVATLTGAMDAVWEDPYGSNVHIGDRLLSKSPSLWLKEGFAELTFDNDSRVTIEAPAEFEIVANDQIELHHGRLYAQVPPQALGFTVTTPYSKIIDLGTEFGVQADLNNQTQLHVIKGKTMLIAGASRDGRETANVTQGQAKSITPGSGVQDIPLQRNVFARQIHTASHFVWKGQDQVSLADIVGGGNGFGTGRINAGIDYTGHIRILDTLTSEEGPSDFMPVKDNRFVDGVFVPNGTTAITSTGDRHQFKATNGRYWLGILNGAWHQIELTVNVPRHALRLNGIEYGTPDHPAVYMSANQGVTFDLQAIRRFTNMNITRFTAACGISESYGDYWDIMKTNKQFMKMPRATFQVLVDGVPRALIEDVTFQEPPSAIDIPLTPQDRFLTLVTTQGSDNSNNGDWTLFAEPALSIQPK